MTKYEPGTPSWVDLGSRDLAESTAFYGALFGWEAQTAPQPEAGGYTMFASGGKHVAVVAPLQEGQPEQWMSYISVADAKATAAKVSAAGGTVLVAPMDVLDAGRMAVLLDDGGAAFSIWEPNAHIGAQLVNEPVSLSWNELATTNMDKSKAFYAKVFGWEAETTETPGMAYTEFKLNGSSIGGGMPIGPQAPEGVPPHWLVYFAVADTDATVGKASELGGSVMAPPMSIPAGRFAVLADPHGAMFAVIQLPETTA